MPAIANSKAAAKAKRAGSKPTTKPSKAVNAAKPSTPAVTTAPNTARTDRLAIVTAALPILATLYDGSSPAIHSSGRAGKRAVYADRVLVPKQRIGDDGPSERDNSFLAFLATHADKAGAFDPVSLACDLGNISRAASAGFVTYNKATDTFTLTSDGRTRGNNASKRVA